MTDGELTPEERAELDETPTGLRLDNVPVSVNRIEGGAARIKFNVDPGATGPQLVAMHVPLDVGRLFPPGTRVNVTIEPVPPEA